jgi:hypothetical protein
MTHYQYCSRIWTMGVCLVQMKVKLVKCEGLKKTRKDSALRHKRWKSSKRQWQYPSETMEIASIESFFVAVSWGEESGQISWVLPWPREGQTRLICLLSSSDVFYGFHQNFPEVDCILQLSLITFTLWLYVRICTF